MKRLVLTLACALLLGLAAGAPDVAFADTPEVHDATKGRPSSGFWGTGEARGKGAYRWKLLGVGVVIAAVAGFGMVRLLRRASAEREAGVSSRPRS